jgi:hypothetical protein
MNIKIVRTPGGVSNAREKEKIHHEHKERENERYSMP